jgi:hypothetical protein
MIRNMWNSIIFCPSGIFCLFLISHGCCFKLLYRYHHNQRRHQHDTRHSKMVNSARESAFKPWKSIGVQERGDVVKSGENMRVSGGRTGCRFGKWEFLLESSRAPQRTQKYVRSGYGSISELTTLSWGSDFCSYAGCCLLQTGTHLTFIVTVLFWWRNKTSATLITTSIFELFMVKRDWDLLL